MIEIKKEKNKYYTKDTSLVKSFGSLKNNKLYLNPIEVLYLIDIRNAIYKNKEEIIKKINPAEYFAYKDWKDRGLTIKTNFNNKKISIIKYPENKINIKGYKIKGVFNNLFTLSFSDLDGRELYERYWLGQYGTYKAHHRGKLIKYDIYETLFLIENKILELNKKEIIKKAEKRIKFFKEIYSVYKDWRNKGFILKTGFKFGTHFRVYFPGTTPIKHVHSKHLLHIFPKKHKILTSEFARIIRVANSVNKTFLLAIPNKRIKEKKLNYYVKSRKKEYLLFPILENEYISGYLLASALKFANNKGYDLLLAIIDDETSVTYYEIRKINLKSKYDYYEIIWIHP